MKSLPLVCACIALVAGACDNKPAASSQSPTTSAPTSTTNGTSPLDAPGGYLKAVVQGQQSAVKTVDTASLDKAIQLFNVDQGRNPRDLNELVQKKYIPQIPAAPNGMKIVYDADSGTVRLAPQ